MSTSPGFINHLENCLTASCNQRVLIHTTLPVSGGDINDAYCLKTSAGNFMIKVNSKNAYPDMFLLEAKGLAMIAATKSISVPEVIYQGEFDTESFLILEWIETQQPNAMSSARLGECLAQMHRHTADFFGLGYNNYMGNLPQINTQRQNWALFFAEKRLIPMGKIAHSRGLLNKTDIDKIQLLSQNLGNYFDEEPPSLLHGDLWGGNYLIDYTGKPYSIDPAVSYGNREFDIAMTTLFGGFSNEFYNAYNAAFPLAADWENRLELWNLYPLLLHLNLFAESYLERVRKCLNRYI